MNNEEIREKIREHQMAIQKELAKSYNFELNPEIMKHKAAIDTLRNECTHLNHNHEIQTFNGRCIYCGNKI